ncbi:NRDE family protein [Bacillus sp. DTU_2020_1000418_1_SI_GHA_SEK_038]|uniref:NRDE family protein n=1 Tax=Bacillus sp. DTU_2020_1000418_1_SI_GHA_SEK_038 TaxID=3077585 RepID=UPI0028E6DA31|nr:NRDE family protein [Bacillus sp. DTU_2020_1000418_1_SI_GHA_SEK_038]WNS76618.1 NRDE family protein [Bacillus sp. DTU_2020_1000418_1_SI_GHA_SEK_038]
MCLILFAYKVHPEYRLVVAANRDEFYARPTAPAHYWDDHPNILAGRDLEKMGTWMGVTTSGRFAALTNYRNPKEVTVGKRSRGELVAGFLQGKDTPFEYMKKSAANANMYPGYNLIAGDNENLFYYSNIENEIKKLPPGVYGVSNHLLNTDWPKVKRGKEGLAELIGGKNEDLSADLFKLLQHADPAPDEFLPNTGVSIELERMLSPLFIQSEGYGTRSSTVLFMNDEKIDFNERVYSLDSVSSNRFTIKIS